MINDAAPTTYRSFLEKPEIRRRFHFLLVVIPNQRGIWYSCVKKSLYVVNPMPNQVITYDKVLRKVREERL